MKEFTETELANEQWRDIAGYDGVYQVSDLGRVRSLKFGKTIVLKAQKDKYGYLRVSLSKDSKEKRFFVHRLVAQAFIPNDDETKTIINHRNEDKTENKVSNLEYCTPQYNSTYNDIHHRRIANRISSKYKRNRIKDLYRPDLTIKQNIAIFKEQGIDCSIDTVIRLRKDLCISKKYTKRS